MNEEGSKTNSRITIQDIADDLGISKTTVSRAISGKGRISQETREKVLEYIAEYDYHPSPLAKGLANQKTYNIAWVMPGNSSWTDLPFFQSCMTGIVEVASSEDYDVIITVVYEKDISALQRIIQNRKVDGVVLGRTLIDDDNVRFLTQSQIPFVVIGSTDEPGVVQIDNDHVSACKEITDILIMKGARRLMLIGGAESHIVNRDRKKGYEAAIKEMAHLDISSRIAMNANDVPTVNRLVEEALRDKVECIICTDDRICTQVLEKLHHDGIEVPGQIKVASFYDSEILDNNQPTVTTLKYDPKELGKEACRQLMKLLQGKDATPKTYLNYEVLLRGSTK